MKIRFECIDLASNFSEVGDVSSTGATYLPYADSGLFAVHGTSVGNAGRTVSDLNSAVGKLGSTSFGISLYFSTLS
jgi:hypothetical protein